MPWAGRHRLGSSYSACAWDRGRERKRERTEKKGETESKKESENTKDEKEAHAMREPDGTDADLLEANRKQLVQDMRAKVRQNSDTASKEMEKKAGEKSK